MQSKYTSKDVERFWSKVDKERSQTFYNGTRCWEWTAACDSHGYGAFSLELKRQTAHRVAYQIVHKKIEDTKIFVCHHCDNRLCCNPDHLFLGTNQDNVTDMMKKGRHRVTNGEERTNHKLTALQVEEIRDRYKPFRVGGDSYKTLARIFGVSHQHIANIVKRKKWK